MKTETANETERLRLEELRALVHDERYMAGAILRLANVLSDEIMDGLGVSHGGWEQGFQASFRPSRPRQAGR